MRRNLRGHRRGFTLIELLTALVVLALLGLMSFRGLGAVLDAREHVRAEAEKWQRVQSFFARFERDLGLAAPRPVRADAGTAPALLGRTDAALGPTLEFSRFASAAGADGARRMGYRLNGGREIELWLRPGLDVAPGAPQARHPVLEGVRAFDLQYLDSKLAWSSAWPGSPADPPMPLAVRMRIVLDSGEELVRVFALKS